MSPVLLTLALWSIQARPCADLKSWQRRSDEVSPAEVERAFGPLALGQRTPEEGWLRAQLAARCELALQAAPEPLRDDGESETSIQSILARPEYEKDSERSEQLKIFLRRIWQWITDHLDSAGVTGSVAVMRYLVLALAAGVAVYGLFRGLSRLRGRRERRPRTIAGSGAAPLTLLAPDGHLARARALLEADPRGALRESLLALLSVLERRRWARPDRVKTNAELATELPPVQWGAEARALLVGYDTAFYSLAAVSVSFAEAFLARVAAFQRAMETPAP